MTETRYGLTQYDGDIVNDSFNLFCLFILSRYLSFFILSSNSKS